MDWIFDHFQVVVLIAVVAASLAKRFLEAKAAGRQAPEDTEEGDIFDPGEGWAPPVNQPQPSVPPPLVRRVTPPVMRQSSPPPLQALESDTEQLLKRQQDMQDRLRQIKESKVTDGGGMGLPATRPIQSQTRIKSTASAKSGLRSSLRNSKAIRRAIIMREILGPPVGLR